MKIFLPVLIISIFLINSCTPADPALASPEPTLMQVVESPPVAAEPAQTTAATVYPTPTIPPTPAPTDMPPGVTTDAYSSLAITGYYMRAVLPIIKPGDVGATVDTAAISPNGQYIAIGGCVQPALSQCPNEIMGGRSFLLILDRVSAEVVANLPEKDTTITSVAFTDDSRKLIYALIPFEIKIWDITTGKVERTLFKEDLSSSYAKMQLSPNGTQLAVQTRDSLHLLDIATGEKIAQFPARRVATISPLFSADGSRLLIYQSYEPPVLAVYDISTQQVVSTITLPNRSAIAFSPDGKRVVTVDRTKPMSLIIWDVGTGKLVDRLEETFEDIFGIAIAPDSGLLYVNGYGGPDDLGGLSVWDLDTRERMGVLYDYDEASILQFSRDGRYLVSSSYSQVWLWSELNEQIIADRLLVMEFYDALSRGDYETAAAIFQPGEFETADYQSPDAGADLASQLELSCEQGRLICRPLLRILPGGGMTNLGDDIVYFQFQADDGSLFKDPNGFSNLYIYVGPDKNGTLKVSYPARME